MTLVSGTALVLVAQVPKARAIAGGKCTSAGMILLLVICIVLMVAS